jgi:hypothetical protein
LPDSVDPAHAPVPTNDSERLLFRQLYRNLVRVDCQGGVQPELAEGWSYDSSARTWTFTLRDTSLSSDGSRLGAAQVLASWRSHRGLLSAMGIDSVVATDSRTLVVGVRDRGNSQPTLFAHPALSIALSPSLSLASNGRFLSSSVGGPTVLDFLAVPGDLRDALDSGVDLLVTRDLELAEYAERQRGLQTFPLPWSRRYLFVQPAGADSLPDMGEADSLRGSLAKDAVKTDARPASGAWNPPACASAGAPATPVRPSPRVVYLASDPVARALAERIVALSGSDPDLRVEPLGDSAFAASLRAGTRRGYLVAIPSDTEDLCFSGLRLPTNASMYPLIDTRARAIVRKGSPPLTVDWDGTPRLAGSADSLDRP